MAETLPSPINVVAYRERVEEILEELCRDWYDTVIREGKPFDFGAAIRALEDA